MRAGAAWAVVLAACVQAPAATADPLELGTPGVLRVAYRTDDKPVSFLQDGKPTGFMVELMNTVASRMGLKVTYVSTTFAACCRRSETTCTTPRPSASS
jgi:polar amino acid transport system substrate-binding protein